MFGPNQPVILHLIEIEPALPALAGVVMELEDCAFPLLKGVVPTASLDELTDTALTYIPDVYDDDLRFLVELLVPVCTDFNQPTLRGEAS